MKRYYINISDFGSIAGKNPWRTYKETLLTYWIRHNKLKSQKYLFENGYISQEKLKEVPGLEKFKKELQEKVLDKVNDTNIEKIKKDSEKKLLDIIKKNKLPQEKIHSLIEENKSKLNKQCGINSEIKSLNKLEKVSGKKVSDRNDKMYYKTIYEDEEKCFVIGGRVDGIQEEEEQKEKKTLIEIKNRTKKTNLRKNEYDLYQLLGYIYVTGCSQGKIVQTYGDTLLDSNIENSKEWGLVTINDNKKWKTFFEEELFSFFNKLHEYKEKDTGFDLLRKPFCNYCNDKTTFQMVIGCNQLERDIYKCLFS